MMSLKKVLFPVFILAAALTLPACKAKKALVQPPAATEPAPAVKPTPTPEPATKPEPVQKQPIMMAPAPQPDYNFGNIQFEFNSAVLKTGAYGILDKAAMEMKKDPAVKFSLSGYASAEGSVEHNMTLSDQRANAVKVYLINAGINANNLNAKGYGEANPINTNTDEKSRAINRRVEMKIL